MADTSVQHEAERWVVEHGLAALFQGESFTAKKLQLTWGGHFAFDAVSNDNSIVIAISTSHARTASGKFATAKIQKLKTDAFYLLHLKQKARCIMVFTEESMCAHFSAIAATGRFPPEIELVHIALPSYLQEKVLGARAIASKETTPIALELHAS